jgi:hypothetical protein
MPKVLPDIVFLVVNSIGWAAADATIQPGVLKSWKDELDRYVQSNGKFSKFAVGYLPFSPPPVFWEYVCYKCNAFIPPNACNLVDGEIGRHAWCTIWVPPDTYKAFSWPGELVRGNW